MLNRLICAARSCSWTQPMPGQAGKFPARWNFSGPGRRQL